MSEDNIVFFENNAEPPRPLFRELAPAPSFPVNELGSILADATCAITTKIQCPTAIAGLSVLGAAALVAQAHVDIVNPATKHVRPISLSLISVAASGERKSAADEEALFPIREWEKQEFKKYNSQLRSYSNKHKAWATVQTRTLKDKDLSQEDMAKALDDTGPEPKPPLKPMLTCPEPTFEGLCSQFKDGYPALGLFSDEGGQFVGGHGMKDDNRLRMAGGLCSLWDGSPIKRLRVLEGYQLSGRRLAVHLMMQPDVASLLLSDPMLKDQGLLSRLLVSFPESRMGTRMQREVPIESQKALQRYYHRLSLILNMQLPLAKSKTNELEPRKLELDSRAKELWLQYADYVEASIVQDGEFEPIRGLANKLPEHALRIAGVISFIENPEVTSINFETLNNATLLTQYFAREALRLFDSGSHDPKIRAAEQLRIWLLTKWDSTQIDLRTIYQKGPSNIRNADAARKASHLLEEHGWLVRLEPGSIIDGRKMKEAWQIIRTANPATNATNTVAN